MYYYNIISHDKLKCGMLCSIKLRISNRSHFLSKKNKKTETHDCDTTLAAVASLGKI